MTPKTKYYQVTAKCGHVGKRNYVPINFAVRASSASEASQKAKLFPRVKKQLWDSIMACVEISKKEYKDLLKTNRKDPYLNCHSKRDQLDIQIEDRICKVERSEHHRKFEPAKSMKYRKAIYDLGGRRNNVCACCWED